MSLPGEITAKLRATAAITALVPSARITQERRPQGDSAPAIVVEFTDAEHGEDLGGSAGIKDSFISVNAWARKIPDRDAIAEQIRLALHGFSGVVNSSIRTSGILVDDDSAFFESPSDGSQNGWYRQMYRFRVMGSEAIPT